MAEGPSRKRPFLDDDDQSNKPPAQKRIRFPKGKKVKTGDYNVVDEPRDEEVPGKMQDPKLVARERRRQRSQMAADLLEEENRGMLPDIRGAEVQYENDETFVDDGIQIEPFNLTKEREEGYFDSAGNYVEYMNEDEIKDAWLDGIDANKSYVSSAITALNNEDEIHDLSSDDIGKIKRRIADTLEPGETVLQALRRLKGTSNNKKEKMSAETKQLFDQLTEDAMVLLENGDYNVYDEKKETFQREAEGYEKLAKARQGSSSDLGSSKSVTIIDEDFLPNGKGKGSAASSMFDLGSGASEINISAATKNGDAFDMFGEDDENATVNTVSDRTDIDPSNSSQPSESGDLQNDYVYDESSGYYYSSRLGYYYDPSSGLYCYAASGQWFSYNEESGTYDEVQQDASTVS